MRSNPATQKSGKFLYIPLIALSVVVGLSIALLPVKAVIALIAGIFLCFVAIYQPVLIIIALLVVCPFGRLWEPGGISLYELGYSLSFLLVLALSFAKRSINTALTDVSPDARSPLTYPLLTLFLISFISAIISYKKGIPFVGWTSDLNIILFYGLYFVVLYNLKTAKSVKTVFFFLATAVCFNMVVFKFPIAREAVMVPRWGTIAASTYNLTVFFPILCLALLSKKRSKKVIYMLISVFLIIGIVLTFGRSRWLGFFGGTLFLFIFLPPFSKSRLLKFISAALIVVIVYVMICGTFSSQHYAARLPALVWNRLGSITRFQTEPPITTRFAESAAALKKVRQHPFIGNGLGATVTFTRTDYPTPFVETTRYIHNSYLFFLFKLGILGLLAFLWLCVAFVIYGIKVVRGLPDGVYRALALGFLSSFVASLIASIAAPDITSPIFSIYIGFLFGAVTVIGANAKKTK